MPHWLRITSIDPTALLYYRPGLPGVDGQEIPNSFKKCQTNQNWPMAFGFELP